MFIYSAEDLVVLQASVSGKELLLSRKCVSMIVKLTEIEEGGGGGVGHLVRGVHSARALDSLPYSRLKLYLPVTSQWVKCPSLISVLI